MFNQIHKAVMEENMRWDACDPVQKWVNTILLMAILWFLVTSMSPFFSIIGMSFVCYIIFSRVWYWTVLYIMKTCPPPEEEEKGKDAGEHYLLEKRKEKENEDK